MKNLDQFFAVYAVELDRIARANPTSFPWIDGRGGYAPTPVATVVARMREAVERGSHNHSGPAFKATCKRLGIKHTRKAIAEYLAPRDAPEANADLEDKLDHALGGDL